jgi:hypothetical protein
MLSRLLAAGIFLALAIPAFPSFSGPTHDIFGQVVYTDVLAKTITVRVEKGVKMTLPVLAEAMESLKSVEAGDAVTLTCRENDKGGKEGVVEIQRNSIDKN